MKRTTQRIKLSLWALVLGLGLSLAACGGEDSPSENNPTPEPGTNPAPDTGGVDPTTDAGDQTDTTPTPDTGDPTPVPETCTNLSPAMGGDGCDPLCQTGCGEGLGCIALTQGTPPTPVAMCQPVGAGGQGANCGQEAGCQIGHLCAAFEAGAQTTCLEACRPGAGEPNCPTGFTCVTYMQAETRVGVCVAPEAACTFYPNDSCPAGENCYETSVGARCLAHSADAQPGASCATPTDCGEAQTCLIEQGGNKCRAMCEEDTDCIGEGETCNPLAAADDNGNAVPLPYGVCVGN